MKFYENFKLYLRNQPRGARAPPDPLDNSHLAHLARLPRRLRQPRAHPVASAPGELVRCGDHTTVLVRYDLRH